MGWREWWLPAWLGGLWAGGPANGSAQEEQTATNTTLNSNSTKQFIKSEVKINPSLSGSQSIYWLMERWWLIEQAVGPSAQGVKAIQLQQLFLPLKREELWNWLPFPFCFLLFLFNWAAEVHSSLMKETSNPTIQFFFSLNQQRKKRRVDGLIKERESCCPSLHEVCWLWAGGSSPAIEFHSIKANFNFISSMLGVSCVWREERWSDVWMELVDWGPNS